MIIPEKYVYIVADLIFLAVWLILYLHRKDLRKEMLVMSLIIGVIGIPGEYFLWIKDWWKPQTITGTAVGIEDFLLGFTNGGIAAVLYEEIFRRRLYVRTHIKHNLGGISLITLFFFILLTLFWGLHLTSALSTFVAIIAMDVVLFSLRKDLLVSSLLTGMLMVLVTVPFYYFGMIFSPGYIEKTWMLQNLSGILVTGIPIEDIIFYFLLGLTAAPLYEFWQNERLRKMSKK